jgi:outer membrane protein OmpA-like peptidoglycan-associated protein
VNAYDNRLRIDRPQRHAAAIVLLALAVLSACETPAPAPAPRPAPPGAPASQLPPPIATPAPSWPAPVAPSPPVAEQRWLDEWFRGTPVTIALADINTLGVDVPLANSFEAGKSAVKPALAAVLDRVATSLRRQPTVRVSIAAPLDAAGGAVALATARAQQVRGHLVARGVPATRVTSVGTAKAGAPLQLRMTIAPQAIEKLDDAALPAPAAGIKR